MRKINKKNKLTMSILLILVLVVIVIAIIFIVFKFKEINKKYVVNQNEIILSKNKDVIVANDNSYIKKSLMGNYYLYENKSKKGSLGSDTLIYNAKDKTINLLGTYYEILKDSTVNKLVGQTEINNTSIPRLFKIEDRKYLFIASTIKSLDGLLNTKDYLLIDIDKVGNGNLYNYELNMKSFEALSLTSDNYIFNVNKEELVIGEEKIDLTKINGSTNSYQEKYPDGENDGDQSSGGDGSGGSSSIYPPQTQIVYNKETITEEHYVNRKTTILDTNTTATSITINYLVYDPHNEYQSIFVKVFDEQNNLVSQSNLEMNLTTHLVKNLRALSKYRLEFYYTYLENNEVKEVKFDELICQTKTINSEITLESTSENIVRYKVRVDNNYVLDSIKIALYIDGKQVSVEEVNPLVASKEGYIGEFKITTSGEFATLKLIDCYYQNNLVMLNNASYKYKM